MPVVARCSKAVIEADCEQEPAAEAASCARTCWQAVSAAGFCSSSARAAVSSERYPLEARADDSQTEQALEDLSCKECSPPKREDCFEQASAAKRRLSMDTHTQTRYQCV